MAAIPPRPELELSEDERQMVHIVRAHDKALKEDQEALAVAVSAVKQFLATHVRMADARMERERVVSNIRAPAKPLDNKQFVQALFNELPYTDAEREGWIWLARAIRIDGKPAAQPWAPSPPGPLPRT